MSRPTWFVDLVTQMYPLSFRLARLTRVPVIGRFADRMFFHRDRTIIVPPDRVTRIPVGRTIEPPDNTVLPSALVHHFIDLAKYHWLMDTCICRRANGCQDYPIDLGCLFLGEAVLDINSGLGHLVSKTEAHEHVRRCRDAGLVHAIGRNKIDTIWLGARAGHKLLTICNCCPCCCLWRIAPDLHPRIGNKITRMPGVTVTVTDLCVGCGMCSSPEVCFVGAIQLREGRAVISDDCRGCGRCAEICPIEAIHLAVHDPGFVQVSIGHLDALVDVS
jgi:ferredoxin